MKNEKTKLAAGKLIPAEVKLQSGTFSNVRGGLQIYKITGKGKLPYVQG